MSTPEQFLDAARAGDLDLLRTMLGENPALMQSRNELDQSAILLAMYHRKPEAAALLLASGVELNLHEAAAVGAFQRVKDLVAERGRLIDAHSTDGFTPLSLSAFFGHLEVATHLVNQGANLNLAANNKMMVAPIHAAVASRNAAIVELLVSAGVDVNQQQRHGFTPLHAAAQNGDEEIVRLLLAHGARRDIRAASQQTAMDLAMLKGHAGVVALLETS
ncbi:MAG: ankyrin repeat domain-containing protein [Acidobacteriia bacterium]|nr:ankyrin repeat domain-containing protein [Terriglobia bacterium]